MREYTTDIYARQSTLITNLSPFQGPQQVL